MLVSGTNTIAVVTMNQDAWAFFDLQLTATYGSAGQPTTSGCSAGCGAHGQCSNGQCVCDSGWGGVSCGTSLCTYSGQTKSTPIPAGSTYKHTQWSTVSSTPPGWYGVSYDDSFWSQGNSPFATTYYSNRVTTILGARHLYRKVIALVCNFGF